jgi:type IV secretory pathway TrbF-like protein
MKWGKPPEVSVAETTNPYLNARQEWNERYGSYIASAAAWRLTALASLCIAAIAVVGVVYIGSQNRIVPYVVAVDQIGTAVSVGRADVAGPIDPRVMRATLARWISNVRSVYVDAGAQRVLLKEAYATVNRRGAAYNALNDHFRSHDPFERARQETVMVDVQSVLPLTESTWRVEWREEQRGRDGTLISTQQMQATVSVIVSPPTDERAALLNPLGIFVNTFNWSARL